MIASQSCALLTAPDWLISTVKIDSRQKVGYPYNFSGGFQSESLRSEVTKTIVTRVASRLAAGDATRKRGAVNRSQGL